MFSKKDLSNNWLASNQDEKDEKKIKKQNRTWFWWVVKLISVGKAIYKILEFLFFDSP
jgi:hypothetical protein